MKKLMPNLASVSFAIFGGGVVILLMTYTFQALTRVFPDNFIAQLMGMILFDFAAIAWLQTFIYLCKSVMQYVFAFLGFLIGLAGTLLMVSIEVILGGQTLMEPPTWINEGLVYGFIGAAVLHVFLFYAFKLSAPEISAEIALGIETANITEEAMKQAEQHLLMNRGMLGASIMPRLVGNVQRNLGLPVSGDLLDLSAYDVPDTRQALPAQISTRKPSFLSRLKTAAQILIKGGDATPQRKSAQMHPSSEEKAERETPNTPQEKTGRPFFPCESKIDMRISSGFEIHPGMQLEAAQTERGMYIIRKQGQEEPNSEVGTYDFIRIVTGNKELPIAKGDTPLAVLNGNGAHP